MTQTELVTWGWIGPDGTPQPVPFESADAAMDEMRRRQGKDWTVEDAAKFGFRLARLRFTVTIEAVLTSPVA